MISASTAHILNYIADLKHGMPQNELPAWMNSDAPYDLEAMGFISLNTLLPPNKEEDYPRGLWVARITVAGRDALAEYHSAQEEMRRQNAEKNVQAKAQALQAKQEKRYALRHDLFVAFVSVIITYVVDHAAEIINLIGKFVDHVSSLFH